MPEYRRNTSELMSFLAFLDYQDFDARFNIHDCFLFNSYHEVKSYRVRP